MKNVVILGAGWAGLPLAHKLLKYTVPKADVKVVLVSPNSHFFWNVAATRSIVPGAIPDEEVFLPIAESFSQYSSKQFEFVLGSAKMISPESNAVVVEADGREQAISFDQLVIATGSRLIENAPLKPIGSHEETMSAYHDLQQDIEKARNIVIGGAGATGIEVAGELAAAYKTTKKIILVSSGAQLLDKQAGVNDSVRKVLENSLKKLGVEVIYSARVEEVRPSSDKGKSRKMVKLSNGSKLGADVFLPLYGIRVNSSFVPEHMRDATGSVKVDEYMRVKGTNNIWALGDAGDTESKQLTVIDNQIIHLSAALDAVLTGKTQLQPYNPDDKTMLFLALGKSHATGQIGSWRLPGFMTSYVKGRRLFTDTAKGYVDGKHLRHAAM